MAENREIITVEREMNTVLSTERRIKINHVYTIENTRFYGISFLNQSMAFINAIMHHSASGIAGSRTTHPLPMGTKLFGDMNRPNARVFAGMILEDTDIMVVVLVHGNPSPINDMSTILSVVGER